jgi:prepilin-type N-terminal cleavage/methylation domain-containing protein/prepilin-type processing-associated H-X9-DG protein
MKRQEKMKKQNGFSLIELLVVILIILVLTVILFPIFSGHPEKSKQISCLSNHRQLGLGIMMYMQDYDEKFPMTANLSAPQKTLWTEAIYPYVKNKPVFSCVGSRRDSFLRRSTYTPPPSSSAFSYADSWKNRNVASIGMNAQFLFDKNGRAGFKKVVGMEIIEAPAELVMLSDTFHASPNSTPPADKNYEGGYTFDPCSSQGRNDMPPIASSNKSARGETPVPNNAIIARHHDFCNLTFVDGHVKSVNLSTLSALSTLSTQGMTTMPAVPIKWRVQDCLPIHK